jgi:hypothetical protein
MRSCTLVHRNIDEHPDHRKRRGLLRWGTLPSSFSRRYASRMWVGRIGPVSFLSVITIRPVTEENVGAHISIRWTYCTNRVPLPTIQLKRQSEDFPEANCKLARKHTNFVTPRNVQEIEMGQKGHDRNYKTPSSIIISARTNKLHKVRKIQKERVFFEIFSKHTYLSPQAPQRTSSLFQK